jgi:outer membrane lipoprotein carrier protein
MAQVTVDSVMNAVQARYNTAQTLQVDFEQKYTYGRHRRQEAGRLWLRKPGKMFWDYSRPEGKLFLSDGKWVYLYTPSSNIAEKTPFKETADMRAPLAFLLGKLDFRRDFEGFRMEEIEGNYLVSMESKDERVPYTDVRFLVAPNAEILKVEVTGVDQSINEFRFTNEKRNAPIDDEFFRFTAPEGVDVVEMD